MPVYLDGPLTGAGRTRVLLGERVLSLPAGGRFRVCVEGGQPVITPLDQRSRELLRRERATLTDLSEIAARLGVRVSAQPKPEPAPEPAAGVAVVRSKAVRPRDITTMIGQDQVRVQMMLAAQAAMTQRGEGTADAMPPHTLLTGPRGTGKTTLAKITASLIGGRLVETTASAVSEVRVLGRILADLGDDDVLFIDEIHGLPRKAQELLYTAMEDGVIHLKAGEGVDAKTITVKLKRFVLVGATTIWGLIEAPMLDRFGLVGRLGYYSDEELRQIIAAAAEKHGTKIDDEAAGVLAVRSKGTPRIALNLLSQCRDYTIGMNGTTDVPVTVADVDATLELHGIDSLGLESDEREVLGALCDPAHAGRAIGIEALAAITGLEVVTVKQIEPLLLRLGLMVRTSRGRKATKRGFEHLGVKPPVDAGFDIA